MTDKRPSVELEILASLQGFISYQLSKAYDGTKDAFLQDELSQAMVGSDKLSIILRTLAKFGGTPNKFSDQEAALLDQLVKSNDLVRERKVIPYRRTPPEGGAA